MKHLLAAAGTDPTCWCHLIVAASDMTDEQRELLLQHLETLDPQTFSLEERAALCDCLRQESTRHQDFPDADWVIPGEHVQRLEAVRTRFEPDDLVDR